ncbi:MAG: glycosyltransferase family 4 protein [Thermoplasmata archaeon]|nr:glycosyltransferase family 4 protein [Thermoplasmata archaeon]
MDGDSLTASLSLGETRPLSVLWLNQLDPLHPWAGGAERHIAEVGRRLVARGHRVTVVAERFGALPVTDSHEGLEIVRPVRRGFVHAWVLANARRLIERFDVDVVVGDLSKIVPWGRRSLGGRPLVSIVRHFNGRTVFGEVPFPTPPVLWAIERTTPWFLRRSRVVTEARGTAEVLSRLGVPPESISLVPPGVDSHVYHPDPDRRSPTPLVAYVGRLKRYKRVDLALRAFRAVLRTQPKAQLHVAGDGTDRERLIELAHKLGLGTSVRFLGSLPEAAVASLYQRSWVHVQPSAAEGWGLTALESMASGTPVVAFDSGALRESVGPLCADLLALDGDVDSLAEAILRGLGRPESSHPLVASRLAQYAASFSWEATSSGYAQVFAGAALPVPRQRRLPSPWELPLGRPIRSVDTSHRPPERIDVA